jgi:DNA repair protein RadA/Sms
VAIGEVGLAGEVRQVTGLRRRLAEAARLGFRHALVPPENGPENGLSNASDRGASLAGMRLHMVADLGAALHWLR